MTYTDSKFLPFCRIMNTNYFLSTGKFISYMTIVAPPSPERFILNLDEYSTVKKKVKKELPVETPLVDDDKVMQTAL